MAQTKLGILIETVYKGQGAKAASKGLDAIGTSASQATIKQSALNAKLAELGKSVASGSMSVDAAAASYDKFKASLPTEELAEAATGTEEMSLSLGDLVGTAAIAATAFVGLGLAAKGALDWLESAGNLQETERRFAKLTETMGGTVSVLDSLKVATKNQVSDFELMAQASTMLQMGLANNKEELAKHFEIVSTLKKPHEELGTALENWTALLANQSKLRLDSFGISSAAVTKRMEELTATFPEMSKEATFLQATMAEAEIALAKVGDVAVNQASVIKSQLQTAWDDLKVAVIEGAGPELEKLGTDTIPTLTDSLADLAPVLANVASVFAKTIGPMVDSINILFNEVKSLGLIGQIAGVAGIEDIFDVFNVFTSGSMLGGITDTNKKVSILNDMLIRLTANSSLSVESAFELSLAHYDAANAAEELSRKTDSLATETESLVDSQDGLVTSSGNLSTKLIETSEAFNPLLARLERVSGYDDLRLVVSVDVPDPAAVADIDSMEKNLARLKRGGYDDLRLVVSVDTPGLANLAELETRLNRFKEWQDQQLATLARHQFDALALVVGEALPDYVPFKVTIDPAQLNAEIDAKLAAMEAAELAVTIDEDGLAAEIKSTLNPYGDKGWDFPLAPDTRDMATKLKYFLDTGEWIAPVDGDTEPLDASIHEVTDETYYIEVYGNWAGWKNPPPKYGGGSSPPPARPPKDPYDPGDPEPSGPGFGGPGFGGPTVQQNNVFNNVSSPAWVAQRIARNTAEAWGNSMRG